MIELKKIIIRLAALAVILVILNLIYKNTFYKTDLLEHSLVVEKIYELHDSTRVLYMGESSNRAFSENDSDKRKISDFIADHYPEIVMDEITRVASHAEIYKILLENIPDRIPVETIIVTLNMRSFNAGWIYSDMETPLQKSMVLLKKGPPLFNRFRLSFKDYDIKTNAEREEQVKQKWEKDIFSLPLPPYYENVIEWDNAVNHSGIADSLGNRDQEKTALACHYIKAFAFQIDTLTNPRIRDFNKIVQLAEKKNWDLVFNLMAENTEKAEDLVGDNLVFLMRQNRDLLVDYYRRRGVIVVDNLELVDDKEFIDQNWTTEHYAEKGRRAVARNVADSLRVLYPGEQFLK